MKKMLYNMWMLTIYTNEETIILQNIGNHHFGDQDLKLNIFFLLWIWIVWYSFLSESYKNTSSHSFKKNSFHNNNSFLSSKFIITIAFNHQKYICLKHKKTSSISDILKIVMVIYYIDKFIICGINRKQKDI